MAQAGIHGLAGIAMKKLPFKKEWLLLGLILGNILPDMDALVVAFATLTGGATHGLHRSWSHSLLFMAGLVVIFYIVSVIRKSPRIGNLGIGLGFGMLMHSLLDLIIWFRGVQIFWPFYPEINFWQSFVSPAWWYTKLEYALEFGLIALFLYVLGRFASKQGTDIDYLQKLKTWTLVEISLFVVFIVLVFTWSGYFILFGAAYIFSLSLALIVTFRMRKTIAAIGETS